MADKIFLDTDVALDHLADRQPFAEYAHRLLALAETGDLTICVSSLSFSNLYYLLRRLKGHDAALALLDKLKSLVHISAVADTEIQSALASSFKDFEDAIQCSVGAVFRCFHRNSPFRGADFQTFQTGGGGDSNPRNVLWVLSLDAELADGAQWQPVLLTPGRLS